MDQLKKHRFWTVFVKNKTGFNPVKKIIKRKNKRKKKERKNRKRVAGCKKCANNGLWQSKKYVKCQNWVRGWMNGWMDG